jgi:hypothetical protein
MSRNSSSAAATREMRRGIRINEVPVEEHCATLELVRDQSDSSGT